MANENHILARLSQEELIVNPERKEWFESCLAYICGHKQSVDLMEDTIISSARMQEDDFWPAPDDWRAQFRPYVVKAGVLQIPVFGVLLNRFAYQVGRYATGYTYLFRAMQRGLADPEVKGIAWIHDSPGGEVAGNFELVDKIYEARGQKPMRAFSAEAMYSASYSIGSAADSIDVTRTGGVGSIGVVTAHVSYKDALEKAGVKVTFVYAGKYKVDGNQYDDLSDDAKARMQRRIDRLYSIFTSTVARNRSMDDEAVRATEAACYTAEEGVEVGLADRVGVFEESLEAFVASLDSKDDANDENAQRNGEDDEMANFTQEQHDKAVQTAREEEQAKAKTAQEAAVAAARKEAMTAASARITAIMGSDTAKARPKAAANVAHNTDMSAEAAETFLKNMPEEKAATTEQGTAQQGNDGGTFKEAMGKDNPGVGAGDGKGGGNDGGGEKGGEQGKNPLLDDYALAGGAVKKKVA